MADRHLEEQRAVTVRLEATRGNGFLRHVSAILARRPDPRHSAPPSTVSLGKSSQKRHKESLESVWLFESSIVFTGAPEVPNPQERRAADSSDSIQRQTSRPSSVTHCIFRTFMTIKFQPHKDLRDCSPILRAAAEVLKRSRPLEIYSQAHPRGSEQKRYLDTLSFPDNDLRNAPYISRT
jgi:hypothetical protein